MRISTKLRYVAERRPVFLAFRSSKLLIVITVSIAIFTDIFLYGVIVPVIPFAIESRAGIAADDVQYWVSVLVAIYGGALLAGSFPAGWMADQTPNRRIPLLIGLAILIGATAMLLVGTSIGLLIAGRVLQGFAGAIVWSTGLALLVDTFGADDVGQMLGYVAMSLSLALLLAPLLGGVVYDAAGYIAVYAMCFGMIGLDFVLRVVMVEKKIAKKWIPEETKSREVSSADDSNTKDPEKGKTAIEKDSEGAVIAATSEPNTSRPIDEVLHTSDALNLTDAVQLAPSRITLDPSATQSRTQWNVPPIIFLLASPRMLAALYASLIESSLMTAFDATLPLRVRSIFDWSSLGAGLIFLPLVVPTFVSPVAGWLCDKYGAVRWLCTAGFILAAPWTILLRLVYFDSLDQKVLLCALLALFGVSLTLTLPPLMAEIGYIVALKERQTPGAFGTKGAYAQAYGLFNAAFAGGCLIGPIFGGMINRSAGWGTMAWALGLLSATTAVPTVLFVGGWLFAGKTERNMQAP